MREGKYLPIVVSQGQHFLQLYKKAFVRELMGNYGNLYPGHV